MVAASSIGLGRPQRRALQLLQVELSVGSREETTTVNIMRESRWQIRYIDQKLSPYLIANKSSARKEKGGVDGYGVTWYITDEKRAATMGQITIN